MSPGPWPQYRQDLLAFVARLLPGGGGQGTGAGMEGRWPGGMPQHGEQHDCGLNGFCLLAGTGARVTPRQQREIFREKAQELDMRSTWPCWHGPRSAERPAAVSRCRPWGPRDSGLELVFVTVRLWLPAGRWCTAGPATAGSAAPKSCRALQGYYAGAQASPRSGVCDTH